MPGKEKCTMLREIRRRIAEENDIALITSECTYQGECRGTCPKCEAELRFLERELEKRRALGKRVALAGVSLGMAVSLSGCAMLDRITERAGEILPMPTKEPADIEYIDGEIEPLMGYVEMELPNTIAPQE